MHIIATRQWMEVEMKNIISKCRGSLDITDSVLQWTPLLYANKSGNKHTVEELLKINVDRSIFDSIKPRTYFLDCIMHSDEESTEEEYESLPECLCSIEKNIHQTSSTDFPAVQREQLPVGKSLIGPGANCNTRYNDGKTSFFHADTQSSLVVRTLKEGVASLDVQVTRGK
jgi:ankyrin repeat protein